MQDCLVCQLEAIILPILPRVCVIEKWRSSGFRYFMRSAVSRIVGYEDQLLMGGREDGVDIHWLCSYQQFSHAHCIRGSCATLTIIVLMAGAPPL